MTNSSHQGCLCGGVSLSAGGRWGSVHCWAPVPWRPELSAPLLTMSMGLWLVAPPGLVRLSVCPSAEPWLLRHPGPGPGHLACAQQVPPAALEEQLPAEVPHQHWLLPETGAQSVWTLPGTWRCWLGMGALPSVSRVRCLGWGVSLLCPYH